MTDLSLWLVILSVYALLCLVPLALSGWAERQMEKRQREKLIRDCSNWDTTWEELK